MDNVYEVRVWVRIAKDIQVVARDEDDAYELVAQHVDVPNDCEILDIEVIDLYKAERESDD